MFPASSSMQVLAITANRMSPSILGRVQSNHLALTRQILLKLTHASAAETAMVVLKSGGIASDAVEQAIRVLEDREITNAGYGSNLGSDGVVECDAVSVDHLGRSGACGAVPRMCSPSYVNSQLILFRDQEPHFTGEERPRQDDQDAVPSPGTTQRVGRSRSRRLCG